MNKPDNERKKNPIRHACSHLNEEKKQRILAVACQRMVLIRGCIYGLEDDAEQESFCDCLSKIETCRALCCTYVFPLTREEVRKGVVAFNKERPYYIARDPDGYCLHIDRATYRCSVHEQRPLRCRRYKCSL